MADTMLEGKWKQIRGKVQETWAKLTNDDLDRISGEWDQLVGTLQEKYGYTKKRAESELAKFLDNLG